MESYVPVWYVKGGSCYNYNIVCGGKKKMPFKTCYKKYSIQIIWSVCFVSTIFVIIMPYILDAILKGRGIEIHGEKKDTCKTTVKNCTQFAKEEHWCARIQWNHFMRTKFNSTSAVSFCIMGFIIIALAVTMEEKEKLSEKLKKMYLIRWFFFTPRSNHIQLYTPFSYYYGLMMVWGGIGSFYNHASVTHFSREVDRASIWAMLTPVVTFSFLRYQKVNNNRKITTTINNNNNNEIIKLPSEQLKLYRSILTFLWTMTFATIIMHFVGGDHPVIERLPGIVLSLGVLVIILNIVIRHFISNKEVKICSRCFGTTCCNKLPKPGDGKTNLYLILPFICFVLTIVAVFMQDPKRIYGGKCDPDGPEHKMTHGYWHILLSIILFKIWLFLYTENENGIVVVVNDDDVLVERGGKNEDVNNELTTISN